MDKLIRIVEQYLLNDMEWSFKHVADKTAIRSGVRGKHSMYNLYFRTDEEAEILLIYTMMPQRIPEDHRLKIAEYVARANYGLRIGNFEFDMRDGEIRYKVSVDVEGGILSNTMIDNMVLAGMNTMDRYFQGFMMVCYGGKSSEEAINKAEERDSSDSSDPAVDQPNDTFTTYTMVGDISTNGISNGVSMDEAAHIQEGLLAHTEATDDVDEQINRAARLMTSQQYEQSIQAYEQIAEKYPDKQNICESQIGVAYYFLGEYEKAIQFYKQALEHGADAAMMADNIAEAEEALAKKNEDNQGE
ncbi:MAG: YbjN domain-containing protein [Chloroflexota bacterium]